MHAIVATVRIEDPGLARAALPDMRLDLVPRAPGFVSAYWLEPIHSIGMSITKVIGSCSRVEIAAACRVSAAARPSSASASGRSSKISARISASAPAVSSRSWPMARASGPPSVCGIRARASWAVRAHGHREQRL